MGKKKKKNAAAAKLLKEAKYPSNVDARVKEAMAIQPPEQNEFKMDNEDNIDKWLRFRPKVRDKYENLKQKARLKNS